MSRFTQKWLPSNKVTLGRRVKETFRRKPPLKPMLEKAMSSLQVQTVALSNTLTRLQEKDERLFNKVIKNVQDGEVLGASILAKELVELRKISRMVIHAKLALEQIVMRISTIRDLGEVVATLGPAVSAIKSVKEEIGVVTPVAEGSFSEISDLLSSMLVHAGQEGGLSLDFKIASEDAKRILDDASEVTEQMMRQKFPALPKNVTITESHEAVYA